MNDTRAIQTHISFTIILIVLVSITVIILFSNVFINKEFERYIIEQQRERRERIVSNLSNQYNTLTQKWNVEYIHGMGMYALHDGYIIRVYDLNDIVIWDAKEHDIATCMKIMDEITARMNERRPNIEGMFTPYNYELTQNGQKIGYVVITYYGPYFLSESDFRFLDTLNFAIVVIGIVTLFISLIISAILAGRISRPITKMAYISRQIFEGNYSIRFEGKTRSKELDELVTSINYLAGGLAKQEDLRKQLTVDISHELRTPLTTLASHLEAMIEGVWKPDKKRLQSCYEEIDRLSRLVMDLEYLFKTESENLVLNKTQVDLMYIVQYTCDNFEIDMKKKNLALVIEGDSSLVYADHSKLIQVMTNLISNAVKYTNENGNIRIKVNDLDESATLIIEDDGIGIPEHEFALVFERFYRTDKSRCRKTGGAGIGLAIVKSIVTAHGGTVEARGHMKQGSQFAVTLPK